MSNLVPFKNNDGLEIVIDTNTGESFASIKAVARMTNKDTKSISRYVNGGLKGVAKMTLKMAEIQTAGGLQGVALLNETQMMEVILKYKPELLLKFTQAGLRLYLHQKAGYKHNADKPVELTQRLLNELYELIGVKCDYKADQDVIIREVVEYLRALNPKDRATLRMGLMSGYNRLECEDDHDVQQNKCINMLVKRLRQVQGILEGYGGIARHLFPKIEQADPENAHIINPSTKQHLLADVEQFKPDKPMPINEIDISNLTIPSRKGNIKQFLPVVPEGFVLDVPGIHY
jgi:hypothetical protein